MGGLGAATRETTVISIGTSSRRQYRGGKRKKGTSAQGVLVGVVRRNVVVGQQCDGGSDSGFDVDHGDRRDRVEAPV